MGIFFGPEKKFIVFFFGPLEKKYYEFFFEIFSKKTIFSLLRFFLGKSVGEPLFGRKTIKNGPEMSKIRKNTNFSSFILSMWGGGMKNGFCKFCNEIKKRR